MALEEAQRCLQVKAWNGAALLARRAVQALAVSLGADVSKTNGKPINLNNQLKQLFEERIEHLLAEGLITKSMRDLAHGARGIGNTAAHEVEPGPNGELPGVSREDAEAAVQFVMTLLRTIYDVPAVAAEAEELRRKHLSHEEKKVGV